MHVFFIISRSHGNNKEKPFFKSLLNIHQSQQISECYHQSYHHELWFMYCLFQAKWIKNVSPISRSSTRTLPYQKSRRRSGRSWRGLTLRSSSSIRVSPKWFAMKLTVTQAAFLRSLRFPQKTHLMIPTKIPYWNAQKECSPAVEIKFSIFVRSHYYYHTIYQLFFPDYYYYYSDYWRFFWQREDSLARICLFRRYANVQNWDLNDCVRIYSVGHWSIGLRHNLYIYLSIIYDVSACYCLGVERWV